MPALPIGSVRAVRTYPRWPWTTKIRGCACALRTRVRPHLHHHVQRHPHRNQPREPTAASLYNESARS